MIATHPTLFSLGRTRPPYEQTVSSAHAPGASTGEWKAWPTAKADYYRRSTRAEQVEEGWSELRGGPRPPRDCPGSPVWSQSLLLTTEP